MQHLTSKLDIGKIKVEFNRPLKATAIFKSKEPLAFRYNYNIDYKTYSTI